LTTDDARSSSAAGDRFEFNATQLAALLGVSVATIRTAISDGAAGVVDRGSRGKGARIHAPAFLQWWISRERRRAGDAQRDDAGSLAQRERQLDVEMKEERLRQLRSEFVPRPVFRSVVRDLLTRLRMGIDRLPDREAEHIIGITDVGSARKALMLIGDQLGEDLRQPERWLAPADERYETAELQSRLRI
jgi:phage terminase Nu1 subunit (DNA packaging protein)